MPPNWNPSPTAPSTQPLLPVGSQAPDFTALTHDGGHINLSRYAGKIVVVDFWSTWYAPCTQQLAELQHVCNRFKKDPVVVIALCVLDTTDNTNAWIAKHRQFTFTVALDPAGRTVDSITAPYQVKSIPTTYVIDQTGKVAAAGTAMTMTDLSAAIEKLLPASAVQPVHHRMPIPAAARRHAPILQGEILLHGVVTEDPDSTGALTISAIWATFPTGSTTMFDAARAKTVNADTQTEVRMNDAEAAVTDIKQGMEIDVYGRDQGVGNPLAARLITIAKTR